MNGTDPLYTAGYQGISGAESPNVGYLIRTKPPMSLRYYLP